MAKRAFYYDIVCPYAYMAFSLLHRQGIFNRRDVTLKPILLGGIFKLMEQEPDPNASMTKSRAHYIRRDIMRQAQHWDLPLSFHPRHPVSTLKAMRMLVKCPVEKREALTERIYRAYWQENKDIDDDGCLNALTKEVSFEAVVNNDEAKEELIKETQEAFLAKVFGVPTISINNRLYFGSDRLELIKDELSLKLPQETWSPSAKVLNFYFDFSSPYSYLAYVELRAAMKASVNLRFIPILLGALFKERGIVNVPMLAAHPNKARYYLQDMMDWAKARQADFIFNAHFPLRSVNALRVAIIEPRAIGPIFEAAWAHDQDIGDMEVLGAVLEKAGLKNSLIEEAKAPPIKDKLKENTDAALREGIFGVPSFILDKELVFGQDRFSWLKAQLK